MKAKVWLGQYKYLEIEVIDEDANFIYYSHGKILKKEIKKLEYEYIDPSID